MELEAKVDGDTSNGDKTIYGSKSAMSDSFYYSLGNGHTEAVVLAAKRVRGATEERDYQTPTNDYTAKNTTHHPLEPPAPTVMGLQVTPMGTFTPSRTMPNRPRRRAPPTELDDSVLLQH